MDKEVQHLIDEILGFAKTWLNAMAPVLTISGKVSPALVDGARAAYEAAGEPAGLGDDAMFEWLRIESDFANAVEDAYRERAFQLGIRKIKSKQENIDQD